MQSNVEDFDHECGTASESPILVGPNGDQGTHSFFSWWIAVLLIFFGLSSWIAINGLWMELPLLVNVLPEGWNLPAYLSIIIQASSFPLRFPLSLIFHHILLLFCNANLNYSISVPNLVCADCTTRLNFVFFLIIHFVPQLANIGPLIYVLLTRICHIFGRAQSRNCCTGLIQPPERLANYVILFVGLIASILLMYFWNAVVVMPSLPSNAVYGKPVTQEALYGHSLGLFVLTFALGTIDCMSSVTFLAYLANMPAVYAGALLFGETASGLLPSLYAFGQGAIAEPICVRNISENGTTTYFPVYSPPNFGVSAFMGLIAGTTGLSLLAFGLLDCLPMALGRSVTQAYRRHLVPSTAPNFDSTDLPTPIRVFSSLQALNCLSEVESGRADANGLFWICFLLMSYTSCLTNGLLPSLQSFSTAAYSTRTFHLAVTLSGLTAPLVALGVTAVYGYDQLGLWMRSILRCLCCKKNKSSVHNRGSSEEVIKPSKMASIMGNQLAIILTLIGVIGTLLSGYIIYLAKASPSPPPFGGAGPTFSVLAWILMTAAFGIQKTWITLYLVKHGTQHNLRTLGVATQVGSAVGALISFLITAKFNIFVSKPPCQ
ncbi:unnamed protein product [Hydatigera taeniaeformis]|uniref:Riboflavin transporter 2 n=1 Tax=Hydatigena taeniaeformis TaxID=6205 RepID=A0A0R3X4Z6_HYDTA|nr:unnamed protein product [Hydatigera taeniaeformis]